MTAHAADLAFGRFLKFWRKVHKLSQEELAFRLDSSPRHISRLENGSSRPSETIIHQLAKTLELGQRDTSHMLVAAGFTELQEPSDIFADEFRWLRKAITLNLRALDPYPALLTDNSGNILMVNRSWVSLFSQPEGDDAFDHQQELFFSKLETAELSEGWDDTLSAILMALQQRALFSNRQEDYDLVQRLSEYRIVPDDWQLRAARIEPLPSFRIPIVIDGKVHPFFSVSSSISMSGPMTYTAEPGLALTTYYPEQDDMPLPPVQSGELTHPKLFY